MSEFIEIQSLMKEIHWGRFLGLWAAFLCVLAPETATFAILLSLAAVSDIKSRVVSNTVCLAIAGLGCINTAASSGAVKWRIINVLAVLLLLLLMKALFRRGSVWRCEAAAGFFVSVRHIQSCAGNAVGVCFGSRGRHLSVSLPERECAVKPFLTAGLILTYFSNTENRIFFLFCVLTLILHLLYNYPVSLLANLNFRFWLFVIDDVAGVFSRLRRRNAERRYQPYRSEGGNVMSEIRLKENESLESALKRFKRSCAKSGVLAEVRKREHYEKPSVKRKKKSEAARKRKYR